MLNQRLEVLRRPQGLAIQKQGLPVQQAALLELVGGLENLGDVGQAPVGSAPVLVVVTAFGA